MTPFAGTPPHEVDVFRSYPGIDPRDLESGWSRRGSAADRALVAAMTACQQVDGYESPTAIAVFHRVAPALDPAQPIALTPTYAAPGFTLAGRTASGVRAYHPAEPRAEDRDVRLFVLPSSTWVVARGLAAQRFELALATSASEPPTLAALPNVTVDVTREMDPAVVRKALGQVRGGDRVSAVGYIARPPSTRGGPIAIGVKLIFTDEDTARTSAEDASRLGAFVERFGATVVFHPAPGAAPR